MLRTLLTSDGDFRTTLAIILLEIPIILISLSAHELAHGYVAYKCGDGTAKAFGRLTLNPIKHLDPVGALCMLIMGYGWAKPVPVNMRYLKKPRRDMALVALAGPLTNFLLAVLFALLRAGIIVALSFIEVPSSADTVMFVLFTLIQLGILLNLGLGIFNLIPLPPLDGANILMCLLPNHLAAKYAKVGQYTRYIMLGVVAASWFAPSLTSLVFFPINWSVDMLYALLAKLSWALASWAL